MFKRFVKIIVAVMALCLMLTSCGFVDSIPFLPKDAVDSLNGAVRVFGDLMDQIKEEGLGSISSIFSSDEEEASGSDDESSSSTDDSEDSSQSEE